MNHNQFNNFNINIVEAAHTDYTQGEMRTYDLIRDIDIDQTKHIRSQASFPQTMAWLRSIIRLADVAFFSCLMPGTYLKPHEAEDNVHLNVHLGLEIPKGSGISVADQPRIWPQDQVLCFDPSFTHEAWNYGMTDRHVLLFTIWHPDLSAAEIHFIKLFSKNYQQYI